MNATTIAMSSGVPVRPSDVRWTKDEGSDQSKNDQLGARTLESFIAAHRAAFNE